MVTEIQGNEISSIKEGLSLKRLKRISKIHFNNKNQTKLPIAS